MIWSSKPNLNILNKFAKNSMVEFLEIQFIDIGDNYLIAQMPVNNKTVQPYRILHGGASVVLAETIGSVASQIVVGDTFKGKVVGVEINANHLSSAFEGETVFGKATPIKIGKKLHVWDIDIYNERKKPICKSRLTVMVLENA